MINDTFHVADDAFAFNFFLELADSTFYVVMYHDGDIIFFGHIAFEWFEAQIDYS